MFRRQNALESNVQVRGTIFTLLSLNWTYYSIYVSKYEEMSIDLVYLLWSDIVEIAVNWCSHSCTAFNKLSPN